MARRTLLNIREKILKSTIDIGASDGVENVTARKIAQQCGITDATVFVYFKTKENLLLKAYEYVNDWLSKTLETFNGGGECVSSDEKWNILFTWLVKNVSYTKYFCNYRHSGRKIPEGLWGQLQAGLCRAMVSNEKISVQMNQNDYLALWGNILESIAYYAALVSEGKMENTDSKCCLIRSLLFDAISIPQVS